MRKKALYLIVGLVVLVGISGLFKTNSQTQPSTLGTSISAPPSAAQTTLVPLIETSPLQQASVAPSPSPSASPQASSQSQNSGLSNNNYYQNSSGNTVHSPAYSNTVPSGATAQCGDGTYSFSQHRQGTCSHHGGVSQWF